MKNNKEWLYTHMNVKRENENNGMLYHTQFSIEIKRKNYSYQIWKFF